MAEAVAGEKSGKVVIQNIGLLLSGDLDRPILDADTIVVNDGLIVAVGRYKDCDTDHANTVIDARQTCVAPGLIDTSIGREATRHRPGRTAGRLPLGREGTGWEVAEMVTFLSSERASYVNAQWIGVDGGAVTQTPAATASRVLPHTTRSMSSTSTRRPASA